MRNLPPGFYGVEAHPGADRIARGEEWLQTNTLDGGFAHDAFVKASEPSYFQEYGPAGYHVAIGFANPAIINDRKAGVCANSTDCTHTVTGKVTIAHMSRTPDERLYQQRHQRCLRLHPDLREPGKPGWSRLRVRKNRGRWNVHLYQHTRR